MRIVEQAKEDTGVRNLKKKKLYVENGQQFYQIMPLTKMGHLKQFSHVSSNI
jgi:hypothetical protein